MPRASCSGPTGLACRCAHDRVPRRSSRPIRVFRFLDNLGVPANPLNPVYDVDPAFVDNGIGRFLGDPSLYGAVKVPTLRNIDRAPGNNPKAFGYNGVFKSLEQIVALLQHARRLPHLWSGRGQADSGWTREDGIRSRVLAAARGRGEREHGRAR
jgi:cytochrome c peroxidase